MPKVERDEKRESRIENEAIVDAYGGEEKALGWYYYLDGKIRFPFKARCIEERSISPLKLGEFVKVVGMADEYDCMKEMFVQIEWKNREFGIPLSQLEGVQVDDETEEAIEDWQYWLNRGYMF